ncbi:MAG: hypothetical protein WC992_08760 [Acholeplasmataceae bacterium]|nr:hypothetical protein [Acholeplasmataceae bacterium]
MKKIKESTRKSYHELMEEEETKKGFSRADLPRKRKELVVKDDEPMVSMARSESNYKKPYGDNKKPYGPKRTDSDKPYYATKDGQSYKKPYPSRDSDQKRPYDSTKKFNKPYKKPNENR